MSEEIVNEKNQLPRYFVFLGYAYLFIYYVRPQDNIPGLDTVPWVGALFLVFTLLSVLHFKREVFSTPLALIFWLAILFALTGIGAVSTVSYKMAFKWMTQVFPQCVGLYIIFRERHRFGKLFDFWCFIYFCVALLTFKNAPDGPGDFSLDANDVALTLCIGLPFAVYGYLDLTKSAKRRFFNLIAAGTVIAAIIVTGSRGGFLGLLAVILTMWWLSENRAKIASYSIIFSIICGGLVLAWLPEKYVGEVTSISDKEDSTRIERLRTWEIGWLMFKDKPVVGAGAGNFKNTSHLYQEQTSWWTGNNKSLSGRAAHSLYFQVIPELGLVGISIYAYIMFCMPLKLLALRKRLSKESGEEFQLRKACNILIAGMAGYTTAGAFISVAYYPHITIWLFMYAIVMHLGRDIVVKPNALKMS